MGLLLGGSVLTVFELIDLIVFRFANTLCGAQNADADAADGGTEPGVSAAAAAAGDRARGRGRRDGGWRRQSAAERSTTARRVGRVDHRHDAATHPPHRQVPAARAAPAASAPGGGVDVWRPTRPRRRADWTGSDTHR